jgi:predicted nucleic acid-binding protein
MEVRRWKVFLDTSALIAGVVSATGAAREVLRLGEARVIDLVVSRQVLTEADRNISSKLPTVLADYRMLLERLALQIVEDPSAQGVREAARVIHHKDAPILAAARQAGADYLVTWNTRHVHTVSVRAFAPFAVMTPGEFLQAFCRRLPMDL